MKDVLIAVRINDQVVSRIVNFDAREDFDIAVDHAMQQMTYEIKQQYEKVAR